MSIENPVYGYPVYGYPVYGWLISLDWELIHFIAVERGAQMRGEKWLYDTPSAFAVAGKTTWVANPR